MVKSSKSIICMQKFQENNSKAKVKFPNFRKELLMLEAQDQEELRDNSRIIKQLKSEKLKKEKELQVTKNSQARARRMEEIVHAIKDPTIENIGLDGSKAVAVLALHSHLDLMKKILKLYEKNFKKILRIFITKPFRR